MAKEVSGVAINMSGRRGNRNRRPTERYMQDIGINGQVSDSEAENVTRTKMPSARGRRRGRRGEVPQGEMLGLLRFYRKMKLQMISRRKMEILLWPKQLVLRKLWNIAKVQRV